MSLSAVRTRRPGRRWLVASALASVVLLSGGTMLATANASDKPARSHKTTATTTTMTGHGMGPNDFGMTLGNTHNMGTRFSYTHGFFCDLNVPATSTTRCEVGAPATRVPPGAVHPGTLFIAVPLGFTVAPLHCPNGLTCVDHPMTVDMTRLAAALAPIFKMTPAQLLPTLKNFPTPGHDHFVANRNGGKAQWWNVKVIGVTSPVTYQAIQRTRSLVFIQQLLAAKNATVVGPIPTNIFLFFAAS